MPAMGGEQARWVIFSVTGGEDKPVKYPHMFRAAALVIINKIDLLPHLDFDLGTAAAKLKRVNPKGAGASAFGPYRGRDRRLVRLAAPAIGRRARSGIHVSPIFYRPARVRA